MSLLSADVGFGAIVFNPFTLGGTKSRISRFTLRHRRIAIHHTGAPVVLAPLRKASKDPSRSLFIEDRTERRADVVVSARIDRALKLFSLFLIVMVIILLGSFFVPALSDISFPLIAVLFLLGSVVSVLAARVMKAKSMGQALLSGLLGVAPAILLILMAMSIRQIAVEAA